MRSNPKSIIIRSMLALPLALLCALAFPAGAVKITLSAGDSGSTSAPVRFEAPESVGEAEVLAAKGPGGETVYAQRDEGEFVMFGPELAAGQSASYDFSPTEDYPIRVLCNQANEQIEVRIDGKPFTTYHYSREYKKPFLFPVLLGGKYPLTRAYPMDGGEGGKYPNDHHHHRSWWVAYGEVNDSNYWMEDEGDASQQRTDEILDVVSGPVFGKIRARNDWNAHDGHRDVTEERQFIFYALEPALQYTDMEVSFSAEDGDVKFNQTKEGGIVSFRLNPTIDEKGTGKITNSEGQTTEKECWGQPAKWIDYSGVLEGQNLGIAVLDNPDNLRHPSRWHIRNYGLYGANCFGLGHFTDGKENGDYVIPDGDTLTFHYRILMHEGNTEEANLEPKWQTYAHPVSVKVE